METVSMSKEELDRFEIMPWVVEKKMKKKKDAKLLGLSARVEHSSSQFFPL